MQASIAIRNARAAQIQSVVGASPLLRVFSGPAPANCAAASTGTLLAQCTLPSVWLTTAASGVVSQAGLWETAAATASGTPGYFRIFDAAGTTCHIQGVIPTDIAGVDAPSEAIAAGSPFSLTAITITDGDA